MQCLTVMGLFLRPFDRRHFILFKTAHIYRGALIWRYFMAASFPSTIDWAGATLMDVLFSLLLPLSVTIDNVVIGQNTSLPPSRVAVISTSIHIALLMVGVSLAPYITPYMPASKHMISPVLFTLLGMLSLWTVFHHTHQMVTSITGTIFLSGALAFDALLLGLTPAVTQTLAFVFVGVFFFSPLFVWIGRATSKSGPKVRRRFGYAEAALFFGLAGYTI
jgi:putative Mn2+ efflux pump MntP